MGEAPIGEACVAWKKCRGLARVANDEVDASVGKVLANKRKGTFRE